MSATSQSIGLNGYWDFAYRPDDSAMPSTFDEQAPVPGCFDTLPHHALSRGVGYYRRCINVDGESRYRLVFGGVAHNATVYLDGKEIASHHGAFTAFHADLPALESGDHELVVAADNRFDGLARPLHMDFFDWYSYGGINRPVTLQRWSEVLIERVTPVTEDWRAGRVRIEVTFTNGTDKKGTVPSEILVDGQSVHSDQVDRAAGEARCTIEVSDAKPWSPESPHLYALAVRVGDAECTLDLGIRSLRTEGARILLNDEPVRIRGINHHESHISFGFALPEHVILGDVQQMKDLGCNFVRTSHYPQDPRFIRCCDRLGLMVWSEVTGWGYSEEMMNDPGLAEAQKTCTVEMIQQYAHHPSIVCWGILNESASHAASTRPVYEEVVSLARRLDPTRPITYASNKFPEPGDEMFDLVDWVSINAYPGWYGGDLTDCVDRLGEIADALRQQGLDGKPVIISELGAGAIPGWDDVRPTKWSLSYQRELLTKIATALRDDPFWSGLVIWQFGDIRTSETVWMHRPRVFNNKGIVDEYRRPKPAYAAVREIYHSKWPLHP